MSLILLPAVDVVDGKAVRLVQGKAGSETDYGSALEAAQTWQRDGAEWVRFTAHLGTLVQRPHRCEAPVVTVKTIKSSNGQAQSRYVIRSLLALGDRSWPVEFTLACRKHMRYRVLLGSKALVEGQLVVNPALTYVQDKPLLRKPSGAP